MWLPNQTIQSLTRGARGKYQILRPLTLPPPPWIVQIPELEQSFAKAFPELPLQHQSLGVLVARLFEGNLGQSHPFASNESMHLTLLSIHPLDDSFDCEGMSSLVLLVLFLEQQISSTGVVLEKYFLVVEDVS